MDRIIKNNLGNFLIVCLAFLLVMFWIFSGWPQILQKLLVSPEIKEAEAAEMKNFGDKNINFSYTDDNSDENLIIRSDEKTYIGLTRADVYFSVTNTGNKPELINLQAHFPEDMGGVKKIEKWTENISYEIDVPDYGPKTFICEEGWEEIIDEEAGKVFRCSLTQEMMDCDSLSEDKKECQVNETYLGSHQETKYKDDWQGVDLSNVPLSIEQSFLEKLFGKGIKRKPIPENFRVKKSTAQQGCAILPGQTQYFKMEINFPPNSSGEFYIEAIGDKEGYGLLDPWWTGGANWDYRKKLSFDKMTTNSISTLADESTILVKLTTSNFDYSHLGRTEQDGGDIRFLCKNDSTEIADWHIEEWNYNSTSWIWVEVPTDNDGTDAIKGDDSSYIYMYYGNADAPQKGYSDPDEQNTYDSHFEMVQHLEETSDPHYDSTSNDLDGMSHYGVTQNATGKIDGADDFDGAGTNGSGLTDCVKASSPSSAPSQYTAEAWIKADAFTGTGDHSSYGYTIMSTSSGYAIWLLVKGGEVRLHAFTGSPGNTGDTTSTPITLDTWHYIAVTAIKDGGAAKIYVDGDLEHSFTAGSTAWAGYFTIGDLRQNRGIGFDGTIDEVRISDTARSPNWIKAQYFSTKDDFITHGSEQQQGQPQCETQAADSVEEATATLNGIVVDIMDTLITERGFNWDTDSGTPYANSWTETGSWGTGEPSFLHGITGLTKGELYYFRAKAKNNDNNWGYGLELTFLTKPDEPTNLDAKNPTAASIELTWTKGTGAQKTMIRRKEGSYPTSHTDGEEVYFDTGTSTTDSGLGAETTYYYRAWSYATEGGKTKYSDNYSEDTETTTAAGPWWNDSWSYRKKINFDKMTTNSISTISDEFTILIKFDSGFEYSHLGKSNGGDIRFVRKNNVTEIADWHIEKWNNGGNSWLWVEVPTDNDGTDAIKSDDSSYIYMYYGNADASDKGYSGTDEQNTYDSHFKMVQHLEETPAGIDGTHYDSTSNNNEGTTKGGVTTDATGKIDGADELDGTADVRVPYTSSLNVSSQMTFDGWIKADNPASSNQTIIAHSPADVTDYNYWLFLGTNDLKLAIYDPDYPTYTANDVINDTNWHYVAFTAISGSTSKIFVDGGEVASGTAGTGSWLYDPIDIGDLRPNRNMRFDGTIDEVRISDTARSDNWIKAQYYSMMSDFFTFGPEGTPIISITISDGIVQYGMLALGSSQDTTASGLNDTQHAGNNGDITENFNIKGQNSTSWTLAGSAGSEQYVHKFSTDDGSIWTALTIDYQTLVTGIARNATQDFDLQITLPTTTIDFTQQSVDVIVQAVAP